MHLKGKHSCAKTNSLSLPPQSEDWRHRRTLKLIIAPMQGAITGNMDNMVPRWHRNVEGYCRLRDDAIATRQSIQENSVKLTVPITHSLVELAANITITSIAMEVANTKRRIQFDYKETDVCHCSSKGS